MPKDVTEFQPSVLALGWGTNGQQMLVSVFATQKLPDGKVLRIPVHTWVLSDADRESIGACANGGISVARDMPRLEVVH